MILIKYFVYQFQQINFSKTFDRYKAIRRGEKPRPFIPADIQYSIERESQSMQQKSKQQEKPKQNAQDDLIDLLGDTTLNQGQKPHTTSSTMK